MTAPLWRRALAEFLGTGLLVAIVIGSGIMAERLSPGDVGLQLLENAIATALGLAVLIVLLAPVSGAHLNPVVTGADLVLVADRVRLGDALGRVAAQIAGGIGGALLANAMFGVGTTISTKARADAGTVLAEVVATAGLVLLVFGLVRAGYGATVIAPAVGAYIGAAYWFTSSTAFANPAVTVGRMFSDTFAGIAPASAPWFIGAQLLGAAIGIGLVALLFPREACSARGSSAATQAWPAQESRSGAHRLG